MICKIFIYYVGDSQYGILENSPENKYEIIESYKIAMGTAYNSFFWFFSIFKFIRASYITVIR